MKRRLRSERSGGQAKLKRRHSSDALASREREHSSATAIAGADEERRAAPSSTTFDQADAAHGFRSPKHGGKVSN